MPLAAVAAATESLAAAAGTLLAALALAAWQIADHRHRPEVLPEFDRRYYRHRDLRRWTCVASLVAIAVLIFIAAGIDTKADAESARRYVLLWLAILGLVVAMLVLALFDWIANHQWARRHRHALTAERDAYLTELAEQARQRRAAVSRQDPDPLDPSRN